MSFPVGRELADEYSAQWKDQKELKGRLGKLKDTEEKQVMERPNSVDCRGRQCFSPWPGTWCG